MRSLLEPRATLGRWALGFAFWTAVGLFYVSKKSVSGQPVDKWAEAFKHAVPQWYIWGLLSALIVRADRRLPVARDALLERAVWHVPLSIGFTSLYVYCQAAVNTLIGARGIPFSWSLDPLARSWQGAFHWNILIYWLILGGYSAYDYHRRYRERELRASELEKLLAESRLNNLRSQLHPHFLFNALNAISAEVEADPRAARRMLEQLGELLRLSLDHAEEQEIPLEDELAFVERYLAIQKVRFEDRLDVSLEVEPEAKHALVPTFVLQPLVENAVKYGIGSRSSRGVIEVAARRDNGDLRISVRDDGPGLPAGLDGRARRRGRAHQHAQEARRPLWRTGPSRHPGRSALRREGRAGDSVSSRMMPIRALIADDEKPARRRLTDLVTAADGVELAGVATCGETAVELIRELRPDLLFLGYSDARARRFRRHSRDRRQRDALDDLRDGLRQVRRPGLRGPRARLLAQTLQRRALRVRSRACSQADRPAQRAAGRRPIG